MSMLSHIEDSGSLAGDSAFSLLTAVALARLDANLAIAAGETKKVVLFQRGRPVACAGNVLSETLSAYLLGKGLITPGQDKLCLEVAGTRKDLPYGEALVARQIIDPMTLTQMLAGLLEERVRSILTLSEGEYHLTPYRDIGLAPVRMERELVQIVLVQATQRMAAAGEVAPRPQLQQIPLMFTMGGLKLEDLAVNPRDTAVLRLVNGVTSVQEIARRSRSEEAAVANLLGALRLMGLVDFLDLPQTGAVHTAAAAEPAPPEIPPVAAAPTTPPPVTAPVTTPPAATAPPADEAATKAAARIEQLYKELEGKDHFGVLGLQEGGADDQIKIAYFKLAKDFHPDRLPKTLDQAVRKKGEELFARISEAYAVLSDPAKKEEYLAARKLEAQGVDTELAKRALSAEAGFQQAKVLIRKGDFAEAEKMLREVVELYDQEGEYFCELGWAVYRAAKKSGQSAKVQEAWQLIEKGLALNDKFTEGFFYLGRIAKIEGDNEKAKHYFSKVLAAQPDHHEAQREMRMMGGGDKSNSSKEKKGFSIFSKKKD